MTREEAIKLIDTHTVCFYNEIDSPTLQALHLAIEALKANNVEYDDIVRISVTDRKKEKVILYDAFGEVEYYPTTEKTIPCNWEMPKGGDDE